MRHFLWGPNPKKDEPPTFSWLQPVDLGPVLRLQISGGEDGGADGAARGLQTGLPGEGLSNHREVRG